MINALRVQMNPHVAPGESVQEPSQQHMGTPKGYAAAQVA